jgi:hypothetical protein
MKKYSMCVVLISGLMAGVSAFADIYVKIPNAAISGFNDKHITAVTVEDCKTACTNETSFYCKSFDFYKGLNKCDLSSASAVDAGALKTNYVGNPYDHYARAIQTYTNKMVEKDIFGDNTRSGFSIDAENYSLEWLDFDASRRLTLAQLDSLLASGWRFATVAELNQLFSLVVQPLTTYQSGNQYYCDNRTAPCAAGWDHVFATAYTNGTVGYYPPAYPGGLAQYFVYENQAAGYSGEFSFSDTVWDGYATKNDMSYPTYQYYASSYEFVKSQMTVYGQNNNRFAALVRSTNSCSN